MISDYDRSNKGGMIDGLCRSNKWINENRER
jgi:hypothetical protein